MSSPSLRLGIKAQLPDELGRLVFKSLVTHPLSHRHTIPGSTLEERQTIYNARQSCRYLRDLCDEAFVEIIHDVPFYCTEKSLDHLLELLHMPEVFTLLAQLTIGGTDVNYVEVQEKRQYWMACHLSDRLRQVFSLVPQLKRVKCIPTIQYRAETGEDEPRPHFWDIFHSRNIFECVKNALEATSLARKLESFAMLRSYDTRCLVYDTSHELNIRFRTSPLQDFSYSHLQHLTIDMGLLPRFSFSDRSASTMPQLKSLTLLRLHPYSHYEVANYTALKLLASAEPEELVLTSYSSSYFDIEQLYYHLSPFSYRNTPLLLVALRQTEIRLAHNHDDRSPLLGGFSANFRIQELEFNDVEWSRFVGRQSEREARGLVETGWDVIPGLCSIADTVHVRQGIRESRFLQRPGWAVEIEGGDTSDEDESEYEATEPDEMGQDNGGNALTVSNDDSE